MTTSAEVEMIHPLGPKTVQDWLAEEQPSDGSRLELILGHPHQFRAGGTDQGGYRCSALTPVGGVAVAALHLVGSEQFRSGVVSLRYRAR